MPIPAHSLLLASGAEAPSLLSTMLALSPRGLWKLDETSGSTATDSSGNGRNGTYVGPVLANQSGPGGNYARFAADDYVDLTDLDAWSADSTPITVFALVYIDFPDTTYGNVIFGKLNSSQYEWEFSLDNGGGAGNGFPQLNFYNSTASSFRSGKGGTRVDTGAWKAIAATIDTTPTNTSTITINVNGSWQTVTMSGSLSGYGNRTSKLYIGGRQDTTLANMNGAIAYAAVFDKLTSTQVDGIMTAADNEGWY